MDRVFVLKDLIEQVSDLTEEDRGVYEATFSDGSVLGLSFANFLASSQIDVDSLAKVVLSAYELRRYFGAKSTALAHYFGLMGREKPGPERKKELLVGFRLSCSVALVRALLRTSAT